MDKLKSFTVTVIMLSIVGTIIALFRIFSMQKGILISIIDGFFISSAIYTIIYSMQWIRERGFFNMIVYSHKRFSQSIRIAGGGISSFLQYVTPGAIKSNKEKENTAKDEDRIKPEDFTSYHDSIKWECTSIKLLASFTCFILTFILSLFFI